MIYELIFNEPQANYPIVFHLDVQECNELCFYTLRPQPRFDPDYGTYLPIDANQYKRYHYYSAPVLLNPEHRPELGHNIEIWTAQQSTYEGRWPVGLMVLNPDGEVMVNFNSSARLIATEGMEEYLEGGYFNPPGAFAFSGVYRRAV